jgi:hypothetical protein
VRLGDVCKPSSGRTLSKANKSYYHSEKIPWLRSGEVDQGFIYRSKECITELGLISSPAKLFPINTVLIAMYGATVGKVGLSKFESTIN